MGPNQTLELLHSKRKDHYSESATNRMGKKFAIYPYSKGLISRIYKELKQIYKKKNKKPIQKWAKDMNRHFAKGDMHEAKKHRQNAQHHWSLEKCKSKLH